MTPAVMEARRCSRADWSGPTNGMASGTDRRESSSCSSIVAGAAGRWLLRIIVGSSLRMTSSSPASTDGSTLWSHGESMVAQSTWPWRSSSSLSSVARSGTA